MCDLCCVLGCVLNMEFGVNTFGIVNASSLSDLSYVMTESFDKVFGMRH